MTIDFYQIPGSAPCGAVALTAATLGIKMNFKPVDIRNGEHLKPEFLKMNPQHTVPTIDDNGFYLWESRAIMTYLVDQYGKNDSLCPKDPKKRAVVNQRLFFDLSSLCQAFGEYYYPILREGSEDKTKYEKIGTSLAFLDKFLEGENYVAGKNLTIADLSIVTTVSYLEALGYDLSNYKNVVRWLAKMKTEIPKYDEVNGTNAKIMKEYFESMTKK